MDEGAGLIPVGSLDESGLRLLLSRRVRDLLLDGMVEDGASQSELEEAAGVLMSTAAEIVDSLGLVVSGGAVFLRP